MENEKQEQLTQEQLTQEQLEKQEQLKQAQLEKQEQLKKLLISADFKEETYAELAIQEVIILKNSAKGMKEKSTDERAKVFFEKREEFFMHLILKRMTQFETLYCIFTKVTNLPYVTCDEETLNDQIWVYSDERFAQRSLLKLKETQKLDFLIIKVENAQFLQFYSSLYAMGVNELVLDKDLNSVAFEISKLVNKPDYSALPVEKRPVMNAELSLTAAYFSQKSALPEEERDLNELKDLEEEMLVNLGRGKVILPVIFPEGETNPALKDVKMPMVKLPNGKTYQPICADQVEFMRFNRENKLRGLNVDGNKLIKMIAKDADGIMLNPTTFRMAVPKEKLPQ